MTCLSFYRKTQNLGDFERERPQSMRAVREAVGRALGWVRAQMSALERAFYEGRTPQDYTRDLVVRVKPVFRAHHASYVHAAWQVGLYTARFT